MLRRIAAALALCAVMVAPARATALPQKEFWVTPYGTDASGTTGRTYATAWTTIAYANLQTATGSRAACTFGGNDSDVVFHIYPNAIGDTTSSLIEANRVGGVPFFYDSIPNPRQVSHGGARYLYFGAGNAAMARSGNSCGVLPSGNLTGSYISLRNLAINGSFDMGANGSRNGTQRDSVSGCFISGNLYWGELCYSVVNNCTINGDQFRTSASDGGASAGRYCHANELSDCNLPLLSTNSAGTNDCSGGGQYAIFTRGWTDSCKWLRSHFTIRGSPNIAANSPLKLFFTYRLSILNCKFDISQQSACAQLNGSEPDFWIGIRDSSQFIVFRSDTFFIKRSRQISKGLQGLFGQAGSYPLSAHDITVDSCLIIQEHGDAIGTNDGWRGLTVTNSTIISMDWKAMYIGTAKITAPCLIDHNTLIGMSPSWDKPTTAEIGGCNFGSTVTANGATDSCKITSNIFGDWYPAGSAGAASPGLGVIQNTLKRPAGLYMAPSGPVVLDWNMYWVKAYHDTLSDCALNFLGGSGYTTSKPGTGHPFYGAYSPGSKRDFFGYPAWSGADSSVTVDTSFTNFATLFDSRITSTSMARGRGKSGTDCGSNTYTDVRCQLSGTRITVATAAGVIQYDTLTVYNLGSVNDLNLDVLQSSSSYVVPAFTGGVTAKTVSAGSTTKLLIQTTPPSGTGPGAVWNITFRTNDSQNAVMGVALYWQSSAPSSGTSPPPGTIVPP